MIFNLSYKILEYQNSNVKQSISSYENCTDIEDQEHYDQLLKWFSTKEQFYKHYVPIQQAILKRVLQAAEMTIGRLQQISHIVKEEKDLQALNF